MQDLTPEGRRLLEEIANRNSVSFDAVVTLLNALALGNGTQAQFNHPDLGGMGQWSQGGMTMVGDMFNNGLKYRVDSLCNELASVLRTRPVFVPAATSSQSQSQGGAGVSLFLSGSASANQWWPPELGTPASTGAQNDLRYAWFAGARRLAIRQGGNVEVYDTGEHNIAGFSQQQGGDQTLTFTSQLGLVRVSELPLIPMQQARHEQAPAFAAPQRPDSEPLADESEPRPSEPVASRSAAPVEAADDVFSKIERLAGLHQKGILSEEEFSAKKAELLSRI